MVATLGVGSNLGFDVPSWEQNLSYNNNLQPTGSTETLHSGSWNIPGTNVKIPDFGASELVGKVLAADTTSQGGSNVINSGSNSASAAVDKMVQQGWDRTAAQQDIAAHPEKINQLLGGGSGSGGGPDISKISLSNLGVGNLNTNSSDWSASWQKVIEAANAGSQAAIDLVNSQYNQNASDLNNQLSSAGNDKQAALDEISLQLKELQSTVRKQKSNATDTVETQTNSAADTARKVQMTNRNVMRALGILNSTYAAEALQNPQNEFAKQKAALAKWGIDRFAELDDYMNQNQSKLDAATRQITNNYNTLKEKIMSDLRYNDQQKAIAVQQATAGAQANLASLTQQAQEAARVTAANQQQILMSVAQMLMAKYPSANLSQIENMSKSFVSNLNNGQQVATAPATDAIRKNSLSGLS